MTDHDKSLLERVKDALGMGSHHDDRPDDADEQRGHRIETERPPGDVGSEANDPIGAVDGAPHASGWTGASGGTGASGAMGGAGAGGPTGETPISEEPDEGRTADPGRVKTEYEMGHEVDPEHERRAESGLSRSGGESGDTHGGIGTGTEPASRDDTD